MPIREVRFRYDLRGVVLVIFGDEPPAFGARSDSLNQHIEGGRQERADDSRREHAAEHRLAQGLAAALVAFEAINVDGDRLIDEAALNAIIVLMVVTPSSDLSSSKASESA
jgi:hypothetical protein